MNPIVRLDAASVERGGDLVVRQVDLAITEGAWFGVIGANGSGKTSLLRALAGRLPFAGGRCLIDDKDVAENRVARAERFGFSPPADTLPGDLRVREIFELVGGDIAKVWTRLGPVREALGLDALMGRWIGDCSAGMRQRVTIALAFAPGHPLVILDEPFNWLDPVASYDLRQALRAMVDEGLTLMTALHDLSTLAISCDAGVMLADGRVDMTLDGDILKDAAQYPQRFERQTIDLLRSGGAKPF
jgi:ABC-2 type transport system ATP-binding protein